VENSEDVLKIDKKLSGSKGQSCDQFLGKLNSPTRKGGDEWL
jgi:hypothetical protein